MSLALGLDGWVTLIRVDTHDRYVPDGANGPTQTAEMELYSMGLDNVMSGVPLEAKPEARI